MTQIGGEILIRRPIHEVFDFVADTRNEPRFNPSVRWAAKVTPGPIGSGTRFRSGLTTMGRTTEMITEITAYERPTRLASSTQVAMSDINGELTFEEASSGTRMRWSWDVDTLLGSKVLAPIVARLGARQERKVWTYLKEVLEGQMRPLRPPRAGRRTRPDLGELLDTTARLARTLLRVARSRIRGLPRWLRTRIQRTSRCTPPQERTR